MERQLGPLEAIWLQSPNGEFRIRLYLGDDGTVYAHIFFRTEEGKYEPKAYLKPARVAVMERGPDGQPASFRGR
jgi:hypothetical protein